MKPSVIHVQLKKKRKNASIICVWVQAEASWDQFTQLGPCGDQNATFYGMVRRSGSVRATESCEAWEARNPNSLFFIRDFSFRDSEPIFCCLHTPQFRSRIGCFDLSGSASEILVRPSPLSVLT